MRTKLTAGVLALLAAALIAGCGDDDAGGAATQKVDPPAKPPPGFRTLANREAGVTVAAPRSWRVRKRGAVTVLRSPGRLIAITLTADRSSAGRETAPSQYARSTIEALPGFEGSIAAEGRQVPGTPYSSGLITARGRVETSPREQEIAVAAIQVPEQVTFAATIFGVGQPRVVQRILASVRPGKRGSK